MIMTNILNIVALLGLLNLENTFYDYWYARKFFLVEQPPPEATRNQNTVYLTVGAKYLQRSRVLILRKKHLLFNIVHVWK
jgi:hypothetical protein